MSLSRVGKLKSSVHILDHDFYGTIGMQHHTLFFPYIPFVVVIVVLSGWFSDHVQAYGQKEQNSVSTTLNF